MSAHNTGSRLSGLPRLHVPADGQSRPGAAELGTAVRRLARWAKVMMTTIGGEAQPLAGSGLVSMSLRIRPIRRELRSVRPGMGNGGGMTPLPHRRGSWADRDGLVLG
jgi:hypothetical protein